MKFGKRPPTFSARAMRGALLTSRYLSALGPPPPASNDYVKAVSDAVGSDWGMMGNDLYGCCVEADAAHQVMLRTANTGGLGLPTTEDVLQLYTELTGFDPANPMTDQGTSETDAVEYLSRVGFLGFRSAGSARLDEKNLDALRWAIQIFGCVRIGIECPSYMTDQFNAGVPWNVLPGAPAIEGGHDVPLVGYDGAGFTAVSWGRLQRVAPAFLTAFCDEAYAELYPDWVRGQGTAPSGLNLVALESDLKALSA